MPAMAQILIYSLWMPSFWCFLLFYSAWGSFFVPLDVELVMFHYYILFTLLTVYLYSILALNVYAFHYVNVLLIISPRQ